MGFRLFWDLRFGRKSEKAMPAGAVVKTILFTPRKVEIEFRGERFSYRPWPVLLLALIVGVIGGIYGVGGGAIIAPYVVAILRLPVGTRLPARRCSLPS